MMLNISVVRESPTPGHVAAAPSFSETGPAVELGPEDEQT